MSALPKRYFTQEEYALLEAQADYKSQYVAGEIFAMAGAQPAHLEIASNLSGMLYVRFRGRSCRSYGEPSVRVRAGDLWSYPDVTALCGEPKFDQSVRPYSLINPQVIFEVLSPSTEAFDRGDKFTRYQRLESLTDYVLVSTNRMRVEHHMKRSHGHWVLQEHDQPGAVLSLASVNVDLPLIEIYERVQFTDAGEDE